MTTDEARTILKEKCNPLFHKYISDSLAGDFATEIAKLFKKADNKEFDFGRDRANEYAGIYGETKTITEYKEVIARRFGTSYHAEALLVWEALDQWEGNWRGK